MPDPATRTLRPASKLRGTVALPPDKSIGHRAAILSAVADGRSTLVNYPIAADPQSTLACLRGLGVSIDADGDQLQVEGRGLEGLHAPAAPLDCGNSGTTMRLLAGLLAGQPFDTTLVGDASLSRRPMGRIADPIHHLGGRIELTDGHAPITVRGGQHLAGRTYELPVASAQVKSCTLLAGLYAAGETTVVETLPSRDHTERMLGLDVVELGGKRYITVQQGHQIPAQTWTVPGDFSAAAFFLVAGTIVPDSELYLPRTGLNPTRNALLNVLRAMGADIEVANEAEASGEPIGDVTVYASDLQGVRVDGALIPNLIDEIPVLAVAATQAAGRTDIRGAGELRVKETDRIDAIVRTLRALGAKVEEFEDGLAVTGPTKLRGATVDSYDDHRIAMALGVASLVARGTTTVTNADCTRISFPGFWETLGGLRAD